MPNEPVKLPLIGTPTVEIQPPPTAPNMPSVNLPDAAIGRTMGIEGMKAMVRAVYRNLAHSSVAGLFPFEEERLMAAADKSALFFTMICGGPRDYEQLHGAPRLRARHQPFPIDEKARQEWLSCWAPVLEEAPAKHGFPAEYMPGFRAYLINFSYWMVNR